MARVFQDDLVTVNSARLRAEGVISPEATFAIVRFGEGENALKREVKVWHRVFRCGGGLSLFICPKCEQKAQKLRVFDGAPQCPACLYRSGVQFKCTHGTPAQKAEARARRIQKLRAQLSGGPLRVHPRGDRDLERRRPLELALKRARIVEKQGLLKEVQRWDGRPTK
jgi:hypothetical protein